VLSKVEFDSPEKWDAVKDQPNPGNGDSFVGMVYDPDLRFFVWQSTGEPVDEDAPFWGSGQPTNLQNEVNEHD